MGTTNTTIQCLKSVVYALFFTININGFIANSISGGPSAMELKPYREDVFGCLSIGRGFLCILDWTTLYSRHCKYPLDTLQDTFNTH